ncbi:hypothetical protein N0B51_09590 [Tsuneonella sp. YG55]|uniref:Uncharacterized protein n=1 Tax=Tsuneonella litorea TaxID=2976475 RepID=A0A9X2W1U6_9SPHN|nr:hypothetical protein [Tsuneonella litorea]MCT2559236.1 hypothetical protein [Tsuneonella litorea]
MHILPTFAPSAKLEGDRVVATIQSGPTTLEISLSLHDALSLSHTLQRAAVEPIQAARVAKLLEFPTAKAIKRRAS